MGYSAGKTNKLQRQPQRFTDADRRGSLAVEGFSILSLYSSNTRALFGFFEFENRHGTSRIRYMLFHGAMETESQHLDSFRIDIYALWKVHNGCGVRGNQWQAPRVFFPSVIVVDGRFEFRQEQAFRQTS